jgi:hypothetical protein
MLLRRRIWMLVDVALIVLALMAVVRLGSRVWRHRGTDTTPPRLIVAGSVLDLPAGQLRHYDRHVVLRARTTCPACDKSIPFFQEVSRRVRALPSTRLTVLTDEPVEEMTRWLAARNIQVAGVVHVAEPYRLGLLLIPTVLITDRAGTVSDILVGEPTPELQATFLTRLAGTPSAPPVDNSHYVEEIDEALLAQRARQRPVTVLDIRSRVAFAAAHWPGALNIPYDELPVRAVRELAAATPLIIDCSRSESLRCRATARELGTQRTAAVSIAFR